MSNGPLTYRPNLNGLTWNYRALNRIYLADCMDLMRAIKAKQDRGNPVFAKRRILAIVDPEYGIGASDYARGGTQYGNAKAKSKTYGRKDWDSKPPSIKYFTQLMQVSKNQIICGGNYFELPPSPAWVVWDKDNGDNGYADCELIWTSFKSAVRKFKWKWHGMLQEKMGKQKEERHHPTQKPLPLMLWLLDNYAKPGDLILDTHSGSGVVARACIKRGFDFIACEIDPDYHRDSLRLLADAKAGIVPLTDDEVKRRGGQRTLFDQL